MPNIRLELIGAKSDPQLRIPIDKEILIIFRNPGIILSIEIESFPIGKWGNEANPGA